MHSIEHTTPDQETVRQWLDLDADGALGPQERSQLVQHLGESAELTAEKRQTEALHRLLGSSRIPVREGFREGVMAALPAAAAWERPAARSWHLALAMLLACALGASLLLPGTLADDALFGTGSAVADFFETTLLAGAGLLEASWRGVGMGLAELFAASKSSLLAMGLLVLCLDLLFVSMLRRRPKAEAKADVSEDRR